jgi:hypothetical protein
MMQGGSLSAGLVASAEVMPSADLVVDSPTTPVRLTIMSTVIEEDGMTPVGTSSSIHVSLKNGEHQGLDLPPVSITSAQGAHLWSVARPYLYTLITTLIDSVDGTVLDSVNTTFGGARVKPRGLYNHEVRSIQRH